MSKELLLIIDSIANEKEISKEVLFDAMEESLSIATKKHLKNNDIKVEVHINRKTGIYETYLLLTVVDDNYNNYNKLFHIRIGDIKSDKLSVNINDIFKKSIPSIKFGRVAAMMAKQIIIQKIRFAEKKIKIEVLQKKLGCIVYGEVKRICRDFIIVYLNNYAIDGVLYKDHLISKEIYRIGDKIRSCIFKIDDKLTSNYNVFLTRTDKIMLYKLLELEVPEISEKLIKIIDVVRDPGNRSKVSVYSNDKRIDPVGSCIGMRGSRIQSISKELNDEKIDIILWNENPAKYLINALYPIEIINIIQDEESKTMDISVLKTNLPQAIGKNGQNIKLISLLIGWTVNIMDDDEAKEKKEQEKVNLIDNFSKLLGIDNKISNILVSNGFSTLEELAYITVDELSSMKLIDKILAQDIQEKSQTYLLNKALTNSTINTSLLNINNMTVDIMQQLHNKNIISIKDLSELSIYELIEIINISEKLASNFIMSARKLCSSSEINSNKENI